MARSRSSSDRGIGEMASLVSCSTWLLASTDSPDSSEIEKEIDGRGAEEPEGRLGGGIDRSEREEDEVIDGLRPPAYDAEILTILVRTLAPLLLELAIESRRTSDDVEYFEERRLLAEDRSRRSFSEIREGPGTGGRGREGGREGGGFGEIG